MQVKLKDLAEVGIASRMKGDFYVRRVSGTGAKVGEPKLHPEGNMNTWIAVKVTEPGTIRPKFLYYYVYGVWATKKLSKDVHGSMQQFINTGAIEGISVPASKWTLAEQDKQVAYLDKSIESTDALLLRIQKQLRAAQALVPSILKERLGL